MPDYSGTLKKFRDEGYPPAKGDDSVPAETAGSDPIRTIKLTDDEVKACSGGDDTQPGAEQTYEVVGKLEGNTLRVMSVSGSQMEGPNMDADAAEAMRQTMPSPS